MIEVPEKVENPLNKYKVVWDERICESDGFGEEFDSYYAQRVAILLAANEDKACDIWEQRFSNDGCNGIDSIELVVEHPLLDRCISIAMIDDNTYLVPVAHIAKLHAEKEFPDDENFKSVDEFLLGVTVPLFESNENEIIKWATQNIGWNEVKKFSYIVPREPKIEEMQTAWQRAMGATVLPLEFNNKHLKTMSATTISILIGDAIDGLGGDEGIWSVEAKRLVNSFVPILVKMRDIGWYPITVETICENMSFFDVINFGFSKNHSYPIDEMEYQLLIEPLCAYAESLPEFNKAINNDLASKKAEEHHNLILCTLSKAISTLVK